ncbi:recombinase family protein [Paraburkholderia fungorum]|uniref:recombinase family protein n=1 Tax=Paraburkholderia fungorum TaxID=134537 RepID=UPI001FC91DE3|nr:recombinase family protein [Paraburkholderia fungorum]
MVRVTHLNRLARSTRDLPEITEPIKEKGADGVRPHWGFSTVTDSRAHRRGPNGGQGTRCEVRPRPALVGEQIARACQLIEKDARPVTEVVRLLEFIGLRRTGR